MTEEAIEALKRERQLEIEVEGYMRHMLEVQRKRIREIDAKIAALGPKQ